MTAPNRSRAGAPWSDEDECILAESFGAGLPLPEIADKLQRTRAAVVTRLVMHKLLLEVKDGYVYNHRYCSFAEAKDPT